MEAKPNLSAIHLNEWIFACAACGSPAVTWPAESTVEARVSCGRCASSLGTLAEFRAGIERFLAKQAFADETP